MRISKRFALVVLAPTALTAAYLSVWASPQYRSTASFMVTNPSKDTGGMSSFLSGGTGDSMTGAFIVKNYDESWDEFKKLDGQFHLARVWGKGDFLSHYRKIGQTDISLYRYYSGLSGVAGWFYSGNVQTTIDKKSSIVTLDTYAYTPGEAKAIESQLLSDAETQINAINKQKDIDFTQTAKDDLLSREKNVEQDDHELELFQSQHGLYKPDINYQSTLDATSALEAKKKEAEVQFNAIQQSSPNNPMAVQLRQEIGIYDQQIAASNTKSDAVKEVSNEYETLVDRRKLDESLLEKSAQTLQEANFKSAQNHYYLNVISTPSAPQSAEYPRVFFSTLLVAFFAIILYALTA